MPKNLPDPATNPTISPEDIKKALENSSKIENIETALANSVKIVEIRIGHDAAQEISAQQPKGPEQGQKR